MKNPKCHLDVLLLVLARSNLSMYQLAIDLYGSVSILNYVHDGSGHKPKPEALGASRVIIVPLTVPWSYRSCHYRYP